MIVTHASPDFDCLVAVWLLKRFCGMENAQVEFIRFEENIPSRYDDAIIVDIRKGDFDHHHRVDFVSSAFLVLEKFGLENDPVLYELSDLTRIVDHGLYFSDDRTKGILNFLNIIVGLNKNYPNEPTKVMSICFENLDAIYKQESKKINFENELKDAVKFNSKWGKGIGIQTRNREVRHFCHEKGFIIFIYVDITNNYRGIAAMGGKSVNLSEAYEKVRLMEPKAEWYLHFTKDLLICGSDKALNRHLSSLELNDLIKLVKIE